MGFDNERGKGDHCHFEKRWAILRDLSGAGPVGVRELSRRVGRDVRAVHADTRMLLHAGVIDRVEKDKLLFPYRHIKVEFSLDAGPRHCATAQGDAVPA